MTASSREIQIPEASRNAPRSIAKGTKRGIYGVNGTRGAANVKSSRHTAIFSFHDGSGTLRAVTLREMPNPDDARRA